MVFLFIDLFRIDIFEGIGLESAPKRDDVVEALSLPPGESVAMEVEYFTGIVKYDKELFTIITANIYDEKNGKICDLKELLGGSVNNSTFAHLTISLISN